jgi:crotonobetainyl-CoA:carnitine CoA-transferase CaiB-like acyl-CoA transferase
VDVSLLATAMWTLSSDVLSALQGKRPRSPGGREASPNPLVGTYRTSDGRHVQLVMLQADRYWAPLCEALGRPDLASDPRFSGLAARRENRVACAAELEAELGKRTLAECADILNSVDAPWAPVQAVEELLDDPQVVANGYIGTVEEGAPEHGEHTEAVLVELGYTWDEITGLRDAGVLP